MTGVQQFRRRPTFDGSFYRGEPRRISELLFDIATTAAAVLESPRNQFGTAPYEYLMADVKASEARASDLGVDLDSASLLLVFLVYLAESPLDSDDGGRWWVLAKHLLRFVQADMRKAAELELVQMRERP